MTAGRQDVRREFPGRGIAANPRCSILNQFGEPDDGVQRGPQLVAHVGQKAGFSLVRRFRPFDGFAQFRVGVR